MLYLTVLIVIGLTVSPENGSHFCHLYLLIPTHGDMSDVSLDSGEGFPVSWLCNLRPIPFPVLILELH